MHISDNKVSPQSYRTVATVTKLEAGDPLPPAYTDTGASTPRSQDALSPEPPVYSNASPSASVPYIPSPRPPPTNYLQISRTNNSIKGTYAIDASLPAPPSATPLDGVDGRPLNLRFASENGAIDAAVMLVRSADAKGPALLDVGSQNGSITLTVEDEKQQHFHLHAVSTNGAITLHLPRTFTGPISTHLVHGRLVFSPAVQARLTTFSEDGHESRFFVGDYAESGFSDEASWLGDVIRAESQNGRLKIAWSDEHEERKGFFKRFF